MPSSKGQVIQLARQQVAQDAEQLFVVMPAGAANVQTVMHTMDLLAEAGASKITLERDVFDIDLADF